MDLMFLVLIGLAAGTLGSLLGLGGGFLVVPALILIRDMSPRIASGTAVGVIVPAMLVALWRRGSEGHVDWRVAGTIAIGAIAGAFIGSHLSTKVPDHVIRKLFAAVLVVLAGILAFSKR